MRTLFAALMLSTTLLATPAMAQSKKELAAVDAQLAQRLSTLESRMLTGDPAAERLMQKMTLEQLSTFNAFHNYSTQITSLTFLQGEQQKEFILGSFGLKKVLIVKW